MNILCLLFLVAVSQALPRDEWEMFKISHGKRYKTATEEEFRRKIFYDNKQFIEDHNTNFEQGLVSFTLKMNHFGDLMNHEFRTMMNTYKRTKEPRSGLRSYFVKSDSEELPESVDWREEGAVTPVKDQGRCGSCWAFSTTGALEGQHFRKTGELVSLSEQNLVDCSKEFGNDGCSGGLMIGAFEYIAANGGIDTEDSYPYEAKEGECRFKMSEIGANATGAVEIPNGDEEALKSAIATIGPISVAIDAGQTSFRFYDNGIYEDSKCSPDGLDHGVLLVGYGSENGTDFWLVKNSWNTVWGEEGYIRIARNKENMCGIASMASYPEV
ncbi:procathepsin L [Halyomorpha halys]|uniref:procathepsin L n=1 Tax=Halyomorpha halys TaxID=286706 RepID=UPI0006D4E61C|nr:cathepsin L1-like [Halyomorpha halys]KAE8574108.1 Cat40 [Halyomorpha halys]